ncbi:MAG TPA: hypothetical protein VHE59_08150 [Mucilaginibacter sp.]|nr:hypothetical protein [Mucilaginibacter sp.]
MADTVITNVAELKAEIARLTLLKEEQGQALADRVSSPMATLNTVFSIFSNKQGDGKGIFHPDFISMLSRIILPVTLNRTLFRNSNFLIKTLVSIVTQKASPLINKESVTALWDKVKSLIAKKDKEVDYGIPPDSEAS